MIGELLAAVIPLPIPASIYGMVLMFAALCLKIIPPDAVRGTGKFLIEIMPVMFVPAAVGLMANWNALQSMLLPCAIAVIVVTPIVMAASGLATQTMMQIGERKHEHERHNH